MVDSAGTGAGRSIAYSRCQLTALVVLRMLIGWHLLYEGIVKVLNPYWTSALFLSESEWIFSGFFTWLATDPTRLAAIDFVVKWGLVLIGLGLIAGLLTRLATWVGLVLILLFYICNPPLPGYTYTLPQEGAYLIVNKTLIEVAALWVLLAFPTGKVVGLDRLLDRNREEVK